ncbi:response regulator transcription factor [Desertibacillus haloalkaliphilus]|uniref:response regulator transcription factor n=1 Tax=Desertibacillus haloalkaliphilus TaxID=1328930 RepID=UPI001C26DFC5|nr:response regulator transcription factor [Desertibacillus haloalkaliphilus]MBU8906286.1 response regulator transcription factor [Desertibacillus haloalkaliphilus]
MEQKKITIISDSDSLFTLIENALGSDWILEQIKTKNFVGNIRADIFVIDSDCEGSQSLNLLKEMNQENPTSQKYIVVTKSTDYDIKRFLKYGATGLFPLKSYNSQSLSKLVEAIRNGYSYLDAEATRVVISEYQKLLIPKSMSNNSQFSCELLTEREIEILELLSFGLTNKEIGNSIYLSPYTVSNYINIILKKLNVPDRTSAAVTAIKNGWVSLS